MIYKKDKIKLIQADCMDIMKEYPDNYFDVGFVDPEYGIGESSKNHKSRNTPIKQKNGDVLKAPDPIYTKKNWDDKPATSIYGNELKRVCKDIIVFGANYFEWIGQPFKSPRRNEWEQFLKNHPKGWIIWDKVNGDSDFNDCELIYTSFDINSFIYSYMWAGMMQGSNRNGKIMEGNKKLNEKRIHVTQKPIRLYEFLLNMLCESCMKILDTHGGSFNSAIAAHYFGCEFIGIELDKEYFEAAVNRLKHQTQQIKLF